MKVPFKVHRPITRAVAIFLAMGCLGAMWVKTKNDKNVGIWGDIQGIPFELLPHSGAIF